MNDSHEYRKSSYSNAHEECVEVAIGSSGAVAIRDSKRTEGPILCVSPAAWTSFLITLHTKQ